MMILFKELGYLCCDLPLGALVLWFYFKKEAKITSGRTLQRIAKDDPLEKATVCASKN